MSSPLPARIIPPDEEQHAIDAQIFQRIAAGDQSALGELYGRFAQPLFSTARHILNDAAEAEDVLHDVFVTIWEHAADFDTSRGHAFTWAITLTRNRAIDRGRSRSRHTEIRAKPFPSDFIDYNEAPLNANDTTVKLWLKEKTIAVRQSVATLPPDQRQALALAYFSGLTQPQITEKLATPIGTIKTRIRRALLKLNDALSPQP